MRQSKIALIFGIVLFGVFTFIDASDHMQICVFDEEPTEKEYELQEAATNGDVKAINELLTGNNDLNVNASLFYCTALVAAAQGGQIEAIEVLINKHGADINGRENALGATALHGVVTFGKKNREKAVETLIRLGADVNQKNKVGNTVLHLAAAENEYYPETRNEDIVKLLIQNGAYTNLKNDKGETPRDMAIRDHKTRIVDILDGKTA